MNKLPEKVMDSKFRMITIAAKRCEQLHHGARPKFATNSKKWAYVALEEVRQGLIDFEIIEEDVDIQVEDYDSDVFLEGDMAVPLDIDPPIVIATDNDEDDLTPHTKKARALVDTEDEGLEDGDIDDEEDDD